MNSLYIVTFYIEESQPEIIVLCADIHHWRNSRPAEVHKAWETSNELVLVFIQYL